MCLLRLVPQTLGAVSKRQQTLSPSCRLLLLWRTWVVCMRENKQNIAYCSLQSALLCVFLSQPRQLPHLEVTISTISWLYTSSLQRGYQLFGWVIRASILLTCLPTSAQPDSLLKQLKTKEASFSKEDWGALPWGSSSFPPIGSGAHHWHSSLQP